MAKAKVTHHSDGVTIIFRGDKNNPEPRLGAIRFPGGVVEVSRTSDGKYWAHITVDEDAEIMQSRLDYTYEAYERNNGEIPSLPEDKDIRSLAIKIDGEYIGF